MICFKDHPVWVQDIVKKHMGSSEIDFNKGFANLFMRTEDIGWGAVWSQANIWNYEPLKKWITETALEEYWKFVWGYSDNKFISYV